MKRAHAILLIGALACFPTTVPAQSLKTVHVEIWVTGIAHLVDCTDAQGTLVADCADARHKLLVIPNHHGGLFGLGGHRLLLLVRSDQFTTALLNQNATRQPPSGATEMYKYREFPSGYEIDLAKSGWSNANPSLTYNEYGDPNIPQGQPNVECPENGDTTSLHWLPRLSIVNNMPLTVRDTHTKKDPTTGDVLARMRIMDGRLTPAVHEKTPLYYFAVAGSHKQAVADYLVYKFDVMIPAGADFSLVGRRFNAAGGAQTYDEIARITPNGNNTVSLMLANVVPSDFFSNPMSTGTLSHFDKYYDAISTPNVKPAQPKSNGNCNNGPIAGNDSGVECGPDRLP